MAKSLFTGKEIDESSPFFSAATGLVSRKNTFYEEAVSPDQRGVDATEAALHKDAERIDSGEYSRGDYEALGRAFLDGLLLNWGSEIGASVGASFIKLFAPDVAEGKTLSEIREEMLSSLEAKDAAFMEEHPVASISSNIAGSFLSPAWLKAGKLMNTSANIYKAEIARKATSATQGFLAKGGTDALRAQHNLAQQFSGLGPLAFNAATKINPLAPAVGVGVVGGAIAGLGIAGTQEEKDKAAVTSAAIGGAFPVVGAGVGKAYTAFSRTRVAQQLGEGKDFVSLMFTENLEGGGAVIANIYKSLIAKSFGGRTLLEQQAMNVGGRVSVPFASAAQGKALADKARKTLATIKQAAADKQGTGNSLAKELRDELKADLKEDGIIARSSLTEDYADKIKYLEDAVASSKAAVEYHAAKEVDAVANALQTNFMNMAFAKSTAASTTQAERDILLSMAPQQRVAYLDNLWKTFGFSGAKQVSFKVNPVQIEKDLIKILDDDFEAIALLGGTGPMSKIKEFVSESLKRELPDPIISINAKGEISATASNVMKGESLVNMRSKLGSFLSNVSENKGALRAATSKVQTYFDDMIESQLKAGGNTKAIKEFAEDKEAWSVFQNTQESVFRATKAASPIPGAFTAEDWIDAVKATGKRFATRGEGRLQAEAHRVAVVTKANTDNIMGLANKQAVALGKKFKAGKTEAIKAKSAEMLNLKKQELASVAAIKKEYEGKAKTLFNIKEAEQRIATVKAQMVQNKSTLSSEIHSMMSELKWFHDAIPNEAISTFEQMFATGVLGAAGDLVLPASAIKLTGDGLMPTLGRGAIMGFLTGRESFQRMLAGQTGWQDSMRNVAASVNKITEPLAREGVGLGMVGGASAAATQQQGLLFSPKEASLVAKSSPRTKRDTWAALARIGKLELLQTQNPNLYKVLKASQLH